MRVLRALGLCLLAVFLIGPTWPDDDRGRPAGQCSFISSTGVPTLCSPEDPLPSAPAMTSSTDPTGWGKSWFLGTQFTRNMAALFQSNFQAIAIRVNPAGNGLEIHTSADGARTFTQVANLTVVPDQIPASNPNQVVTLFRTTGPTYLLGLNHAGGATGIWSSSSGYVWTEASATGLPATFRVGTAFAQQGSTILGVVANTGGTDSVVCRSTNDGVTWACTNHGAIDRQVNQGLATPTAGIWLAIDTTSPRNLSRSTDDGVSFSVVTTFPDGTFPGQAVECITATICVASAGNRIHRSIDAGLTWAEVIRLDGATARIRGFADFGSGVVVALASDDTSQVDYWTSSDFGLSWNQTASLTGVTMTTAVFGANCDTRAGRGLCSLSAPGASLTTEVMYSPVVFGQIVQSESGNPWDINTQGEGGVFQGTGGSPSPWTQAGPVQGPTLFNSEVTGPPATPVVIAIAPAVGERGHVYSVDARCSAGTAGLIIDVGGLPIWTTLPAEVTTARLRVEWPTGLTGTTGIGMGVTLTPCAGTGTLTVQADRF